MVAAAIVIVRYKIAHLTTSWPSSCDKFHHQLDYLVGFSHAGMVEFSCMVEFSRMVELSICVSAMQSRPQVIP